MSSNIFVTAYDSTAKNFAEIFCVMIRKVLIVQLLLQNEPERAVRILAKMKRMNVKPNRRTYEILFSLFGNINIPYEEGNVLSHVDVSKRISIIEMDMLSNEIEHSFVSMKNLVSLFSILHLDLHLSRCNLEGHEVSYVLSLEETFISLS
jgi:hypothetical protein